MTISATFRPVTFALLAATMLSGAAMAQTPQPSAPRPGANVETKGAAVAAGAPSQIDLAERLFDLGRSSQDTLLVIAAARLALNAPTPGGTREPDARSTGAKPEGIEAAGPDRDAMVAAARQMAASSGDPALVAMAQNLVAPAARGRVAGTLSDRDWLNTGRTMTYSRMMFRGGETAEIALRGGSNARLNLSVFDENGNTICVSRRAGSNQFCSWNPSWTGPFRVVIDNVGSYHTEYVLVTN